MKRWNKYGLRAKRNWWHCKVTGDKAMDVSVTHVFKKHRKSHLLTPKKLKKLFPLQTKSHTAYLLIDGRKSCYDKSPT